MSTDDQMRASELHVEAHEVARDEVPHELLDRLAAAADGARRPARPGRSLGIDDPKSGLIQGRQNRTRDDDRNRRLTTGQSVRVGQSGLSNRACELSSLLSSCEFCRSVRCIQPAWRTPLSGSDSTLQTLNWPVYKKDYAEIRP